MTNKPLEPIVEMNVGGVWTDITADVRLNSADSGGGIEITRGVPNEGNSTEPTQLNFVLNNREGKYSPKNPLSPNFGKLGRNTQIRVAKSRRSDTFQRTEVDTWGRLPSRVNPELATVLGDRWELTGTASRFDVSPGAATIASTSGYSVASFGAYGDVDIRAKVSVSNLTSEFGVMLRFNSTQLVPISDFENGLGTWAPVGGTSTLAVSTSQAHSGTTSALFTVAGSPSQAYARPALAAVIPGRTYRARMWVRPSTTITVIASIDWIDANGSYVSGAYNGVSCTANTWTLLEVSGVAPDAAASGSYGPNLDTAPVPPNGTTLYFDDVEFMDYGAMTFYSAYITPGSPDQLRLGRVAPGTGSAVSQNRSTNVVINTPYWFRAQMTGTRRRVKFWKDGDPEPSAWNFRTYAIAAANDDPAIPDFGQVGLFAQGGSAVVTFSEVTVNEWRAHAEIAELPPRWDLSRQDRWVPVQARGILRRLGQGRKALESAVTQHLNEYTTALMWIPLETVDDVGTIAGNRISGGENARISQLSQGSVDESGTYAAPGIAGCAVLDEDASSIIARTKPGAPSGTWSFMCFIRYPNVVIGPDVVIYRVETTGSARSFVALFTTNGGLRVEARDGEGNVLSSQQSLLYFADIPVGSWVATCLYVTASGGTVTWRWDFHKPGGSVFFFLTGTYSGSGGTFREVRFAGDPNVTAIGGLQVAHLFHYPAQLPFVTSAFARAAYAYIGESAISRWLRLTQNAQISATTTGLTSQSKLMGAQGMDKLLGLLEEIAEADDSVIMEERDDFGLNLHTREAMYNPRALTLDIDQGHVVPPLEPNYDDQNTRNDVTVSRDGGSFARSVQTTGPLNINPPEVDPVDGVGTYDAQYTQTLYQDSQLRPAANWLRSKGTIDEARYPSVSVNLLSSAYENDPGLTATLISKDTGNMVSLRNSEVGYNPSDQIVQAYTEFMDQYEWTYKLTTMPGTVWRVGQVGRTTRLATRYLATSGSFAAGTSNRITVARTLPGALMVTPSQSPRSFPFEIEASGVRLLVEATGDVLNTNPYFETDLSGWIATGAATLYRDRYSGQFREGTASMRMTCTATGTVGAENTQAAAATTTPAVQYQISGWVMTQAASSTARISVDWYQSNGTTFISTSTPTALSTAAMTWTFFSATVTAPALGARARIKPNFALNTGQIAWVDAVRLMPVSSYSASPQTLSVRQLPTNGVLKTIPSGSPVSIVAPWRVAY